MKEKCSGVMMTMTLGILYREDVKKGKAKVYKLGLTLAIADGILQIKS